MQISSAEWKSSTFLGLILALVKPVFVERGGKRISWNLNFKIQVSLVWDAHISKESMVTSGLWKLGQECKIHAILFLLHLLLYHLSHSTSSFFIQIMVLLSTVSCVAGTIGTHHYAQLDCWHGVSWTFCTGLASNHDTPDPHFPSSWDCRCEPRHLADHRHFHVTFSFLSLSRNT
jgi:hypothetical protein